MTRLNDQLSEPSVLSVLASFPIQGAQASLSSLLLLLAICTPRTWGSFEDMAANQVPANLTPGPSSKAMFPVRWQIHVSVSGVPVLVTSVCMEWAETWGLSKS